jgi:hypothetical protein
MVFHGEIPLIEELLVVWIKDGSVDVPICPGALPGAAAADTSGPGSVVARLAAAGSGTGEDHGAGRPDLGHPPLIHWDFYLDA